jgi:DNA polymerase IV
VSAVWPRIIAHADMDAFYASIEQHDAPELRGRPVLVGPRSLRGVVLTASYEARPFGVGSAMPMARARRLCPQAVVVPPRFERYKQVSAQLMRALADFSARVEPLSLDEAFVDMSGSSHIFGDARSIGARLKAAIREATGGLTASVGVSASKYVAKVASSFAKPDGLTVVPPDEVRAWLAPQPISRLWGAGPKTQARLAEMGFATIGDVAGADPARLTAALGRIGVRFHALSRGEDVREVAASRTAKSLSCERTLERDIDSREEIERQLRKAADGVGRRLRKNRLLAGGVRVKLKTSAFRVLTRQQSLPAETQSSEVLYGTAAALLAAFDERGPFRLVGVCAYDLCSAAESTQLDLDVGDGARSRRLDAALDAVARRFGPGAVQRGSDAIGQSGIVGDVNLDFLNDDG